MKECWIGFMYPLVGCTSSVAVVRGVPSTILREVWNRVVEVDEYQDD